MKEIKIFRKSRNKLIFTSCLFLLAACETSTIYHSYCHLPTGGWNKGDTLFFNYGITDSASKYKVSVEIRHDGHYPYRNLALFVLRNTADSVFFITDTLQCTLTTPKGKWLGSGLGTLYQISFPYHTFSFPHNRTYTFKIGHLMQENTLKGINDIGICIEKIDPQ